MKSFPLLLFYSFKKIHVPFYFFKYYIFPSPALFANK